MGVDYYAYACLGVRVDPEKLYKTIKVKAMAHDFSEDFEYHPKTGDKLWKEKRVPVEGVEGDDGEALVGGYPVLFGTDRKEAVICLILSETGSSRSGRSFMPSDLIDPTKLVEQVEAMRKALEPLGFWGKFGLHSILYRSY